MLFPGAERGGKVPARRGTSLGGRGERLSARRLVVESCGRVAHPLPASGSLPPLRGGHQTLVFPGAERGGKVPARRGTSLGGKGFALAAGHCVGDIDSMTGSSKRVVATVDVPGCAVEAGLGVTLDRCEHVAQALEYVHVPEPHHDESMPLDDTIARVVSAWRVLAAVAFDGDTVFETREVDDVLGDRVLSPIPASELSPSQPSPQQSLGMRHVFAQLSCAIATHARIVSDTPDRFLWCSPEWSEGERSLPSEGRGREVRGRHPWRAGLLWRAVVRWHPPTHFVGPFPQQAGGHQPCGVPRSGARGKGPCGPRDEDRR